MDREREVRETVEWAMREQERRATERGIVKGDTLAELALIYEIGAEISRRPRPSLWQRLTVFVR